ncbi:hypothetical protein SAMN05518801_1064 [Novosphingobium sp. CF614]|uniref:hypothetical protein n=1 Tax=Novosphingobium sp. CF614 TaxID=1884364 RepID=UPI0008DEBF76|nr:hypothetical protein [Novosphingobium sp. CF614]SFG03337.1 hypothetical protein SAMN05518801_1064 [Novosphingobium sp. CF614]
MDLNQLLFHHQVALIENAAARCEALRQSRFNLFAHYERRIARLRREAGLFKHPNWL